MFMFHELNVGQKYKPKNIIRLFSMSIDTDFPFTRILFYINSTSINVLSPLNHISNCTFFSDFDTF